ncbi:MAG: GlsB/YeaQ/YmgE family stress response membrane protein [Silicimonas sp.]
MGLIAFLIIGGIAGWLASTFMNKEQGILMNIIVGIVGAYVGGFLGNVVGLDATGFVGSIIMATIGAVILLWVLGKLKKG